MGCFFCLSPCAVVGFGIMNLILQSLNRDKALILKKMKKKNSLLFNVIKSEKSTPGQKCNSHHVQISKKCYSFCNFLLKISTILISINRNCYLQSFNVF